MNSLRKWSQCLSKPICRDEKQANKQTLGTIHFPLSTTKVLMPRRTHSDEGHIYKNLLNQLRQGVLFNNQSETNIKQFSTWLARVFPRQAPASCWRQLGTVIGLLPCSSLSTVIYRMRYLVLRVMFVCYEHLLGHLWLRLTWFMCISSVGTFS